MTIANFADALIRLAAQLLDLVSNNQLASALAGAAIIGVLGYLTNAYRNRRDSSKIHRFLSESSQTTSYLFRNTHAISAATRVPEDRVAKLCLKDKRIERNKREKESWRLAPQIIL